MSTHLYHLILRIAEAEGSITVDDVFKEKLTAVLESNDLATEQSVPKWLTEVFSRIAAQESTPVTKFLHREPGTGDAFNFIAELEEIMEKEWDDSGEEVEMHFDRIRVIASISLESSTYYIRHYEAANAAS